MNNLRGIFLVILSMAFFSLEDMFIKRMTETIPTGQVMATLGLGGALVFGLLAARQGQRLFGPATIRNGALALRTLSEGFAALFFITSLSLVPISTVSAVFQATPLAITLGAAVFLGEQVGWRRWSAILLGFVGVLIIIRPGMTGFQPASLFVLGAVVAIATRDLTSRRLPQAMSSTVVSFYGFAAIGVAGLPLLLITGATPQAMTLVDVGQMACALVFGVLGYYAIVSATRMGDAAAVTPFRYTRLIFSIALGMLVFGERPDLLTYVGSALIIITGLYTFLRERRAAARLVPMLDE
ncbi:DMT family transporter [Thalassovita taeanensis]|uniref:Permease of the drug/metabolite transporter (DMT) superfamily n=1 Tax=Thalassovita taeanensis TaxID=657014 RepID=A0A1H8Z066_9RHOB|nr:DMT family transporter [Thalassovita taeanensis]SEP57018.1 Permease of the drug/metabolite transporter (DMT) superfamily [Thalassovita taeanensis]